MIERNLTAIRAKAFEDLEDPIAQLQCLVTVAAKYHSAVLDKSNSVSDLLTAQEGDAGVVIAMNDEEYESMNFIMLELVFAIRDLNKQYFSFCRDPEMGSGS